MSGEKTETLMIDSNGVIRAYAGIPGFLRVDCVCLKVFNGEDSRATFVLPRSIAGKMSYVTRHMSSSPRNRHDSTPTPVDSVDMPNMSPDAFDCVVQYISTGTFDIAVPLVNWTCCALKTASNQTTKFSTTTRNLWLDWNENAQDFSLRLYGGVRSKISESRFSVSDLEHFNAPKMTLDVDQLSVTIKPGPSEVKLTFWSKDDLFDFLLQVLCLLRTRRCLACESRTPDIKIEDGHIPPNMRTGTPSGDRVDDSSLDVRSCRFRLQLLDRAFEVYKAANLTNVTAMYPLLLGKIKDVLAGGEDVLKIELAERMQRYNIDYHEALKEYVSTLLYPMFHDINTVNDLNFKGDFKGALAEALRRAGVV